MKVLRFLALVLFPALLAMLILSACAPAVAGFVELPDPVRVQITGLVVLAVSWAFAWLIAKVPFLKFLEGYKEPLALALAAELIVVLQNALPSAFPEISLLAVQLVLAVLAAWRLFKIFGVKGYRFFR
jgi:hypothetical protein